MEKEILTLKIEKLIYGGRSLAKKDNYPFFIDGGCPGDIVEVNVIKRNKSYGIAEITQIVQESQNRVKPICPMHNICGGCGLQYIEYNEQLIQKENIVKETISKIYGKDVTILPVKTTNNIYEYRHKVQYPVSQTKVSKRLIAGYYKRGTHEAVNIKYCPVQPKILDEIIEFIRTKASELNISGYNEKKHIGMLRHVVFRISNSNKKVLVTLVLNDNKINKNIRLLAEEIQRKFQTAGVLANFNTAKTNVITGKITERIIGDTYILENIGNITYKISATSFFQVNPQAAKILFDTAKEMITETGIKQPDILDAYSGVSAFALQLKDVANEIICVEECKSSTDDAEYNVNINNAKNVKVINDDAAKTFEKFVNTGKTFDIVLLDPPRKGCSKESLDYAAKLSKKYIIYVSCNPSTLASDLKYLEEKNFIPKVIQPVDMFCHTPHIENITLIEKNK